MNVLCICYLRKIWWELSRIFSALRARELCIVAARLSKANAEAAALAVAQQKESESKSDTTQAIANQSNVRKPSVNNAKGGRPQQIQPTTSTVPSQPSSTNSFVSKRLDIQPQLNEQGEEEDLYNCILPDDVLVELLADRMQVGAIHFFSEVDLEG